MGYCAFFIFFVLFFILLNFYIQYFSGGFDTSGSMIPLSVSEISALDGFCDEEHEQQEWGILVVGLRMIRCVSSEVTFLPVEKSSVPFH